MKQSERINAQFREAGCGCETCLRRWERLKPVIEAIGTAMDGLDVTDKENSGIVEFFDVALVTVNTLVELHPTSFEMATGQMLSAAEKFRAIGNYMSMKTAASAAITEFVREYVVMAPKPGTGATPVMPYAVPTGPGDFGLGDVMMGMEADDDEDPDGGDDDGNEGLH